MNSWQTRTLGSLCKIEIGKTPARADASLWDQRRQRNNVWLSIADLLNVQEYVVVDSKEYISDKGAAICKGVPKGTLLVSFKLTLGRLAFAGRDLYTNEAIAPLTIRNERELSKEYLFYFLQFFDWDKASEGDVKIKGKTLNKAKLQRILIDFPPLREQQRIVRILSKVTAGIGRLRANAETNRENGRELSQGLLTEAVVGTLTREWRRTHADTESCSEALKRALDERRKQWRGSGAYKQPQSPLTNGPVRMPTGWTLASPE